MVEDKAHSFFMAEETHDYTGTQRVAKGAAAPWLKGMALTAASASSRRVAFLLAHPRSKGIPVTFFPALFRCRETTS